MSRWLVFVPVTAVVLVVVADYLCHKDVITRSTLLWFRVVTAGVWCAYYMAAFVVEFARAEFVTAVAAQLIAGVCAFLFIYALLMTQRRERAMPDSASSMPV